MSTLWHPCRMRQGATETIGWIEARGARKGATVELKTDPFDKGPWLILDVFAPGTDGAEPREKQAIDRKGLPSIERRTNA